MKSPLLFTLKSFVVVCVLLPTSMHVHATHLRAGEIRAERLDCPGRTFRITVLVYTNPNSDALFGGDEDVLNFGDGHTMLVPVTRNTIRYDLDPEGRIATASFTVIHNYASVGSYWISYKEPNRNDGVLNMDQSVFTTFYIETLIKIDPYYGCNSSPKLNIPPVDRGCKGVAFFHNPGAYDNDGDSLSYEMKIPFSDRDKEVVHYRSPNDAKFYTNYSISNEDHNGTPTFKIDPLTGTLTWDAPGALGEYNIAFHIIEWRKIDGVWFSIGYVRRDMQIVIEDCDNSRPDLSIPSDTCVMAGTTLSAIIEGIDKDNNPVKIEAFSEIFNLAPAQSPAQYSPVPGADDFRNPPARTNFVWNTACLHVREQPYQVVFKVTDKPKRGPRLVTYKTWFITVVAPPPIWRDVRQNKPERSITLQWESYECLNAEKIQVWRKIEGTAYTPAHCETGMPSLGYTLITTLPLRNGDKSVVDYTDDGNGNGLVPGAAYCYRLVAVFPEPKGGESYVSKDTCVRPIPATVPIITHVSVEKTLPSNGEIRISWRSPFDADPSQYPRPYSYDVYRASGKIRSGDSLLIANHINDTTFIDNALNTRDYSYNYSVVAFDHNGRAVGSSRVASSVRLSSAPTSKEIVLHWEAAVPWSNQIVSFPNQHLIYRESENASEQDLVLIDSVDVTSKGFTFSDHGQHGALKAATTYCYRIMTRGGYGNPKITQPLENFSQIFCTQLGDTIAPCEPILQAQALDCDQYLQESGNCNPTRFSNTIFWSRSNDACNNDILGYKIYRANNMKGEFTYLENTGIIQDTFFIDRNITSFAYCYKIRAIDRSLNESTLSEAVCLDNCPYYELPNVFTPDGDGCNDRFTAYGGQVVTGKCPYDHDINQRCARFVQSVVFKVYNRWGEEVYAYTGSINDEQTIYIQWDGKDNHGHDLSSGVYYYVADVTFDVSSSNKVKKYKGWVHLLRGGSE
jgi:hypothetical protein